MEIFFIERIISGSFYKFFYSHVYMNETSIVYNIRKEMLENIFFVVRSSNFLNFESLIDIFGLDLLERLDNYRLRLYYVFFNRIFGFSLNLKLNLNSKDILLSAIDYFNSANWLEREVYDMYGFFFYKNFDMRRILTDYGFIGYPLRKDFPLTGFTEVQYSEEEKIVISQSIKVNQSVRLFHFSNVWDMVKKNLNRVK
jgi:NADH-quinone oxidoreductase subunit C